MGNQRGHWLTIIVLDVDGWKYQFNVMTTRSRAQFLRGFTLDEHLEKPRS